MLIEPIRRDSQGVVTAMPKEYRDVVELHRRITASAPGAWTEREHDFLALTVWAHWILGPTRRIDRWKWREMFERLGYVEQYRRKDRPQWREPRVLYRGSSEATQGDFAWTTSLEIAAMYAVIHTEPGQTSHVWMTRVTPSDLYGGYRWQADAVMAAHVEYAVDTRALNIEAYDGPPIVMSASRRWGLQTSRLVAAGFFRAQGRGRR